MVGRNFHNFAIGLPLPFCLQINKIIDAPTSIEILTSLAQAYRVEGGGWKFRNYPVFAIVNF